MIKVITCIKRKPGMSVEDFQAYWRTDHAEVVKGLPNLRRYIQSHALPGGYRKGELPYDGIAEI
ncbi:MAG: EthD domain-containing protein, partial [Alphaproteobacteria bacterium]|nr:EthD domain-containing protein [Alphaproteobacteria bacterium]